MDIVIATSNVHKVREFREMFKLLKNLEVLSLKQFPYYIVPEETGSTFQENALLKAEHAAKALKKIVLADDSGLVVPALSPQPSKEALKSKSHYSNRVTEVPGVYSKRYAGEQASDAENRQKLLRDMAHLEESARCAYFECCLVIASPEGVLKCVSARCEGFIIQHERGRNGFGYDPLFIKFDYDKTFAELEESIKNRISHRRKAFERLLPFLETLV